MLVQPSGGTPPRRQPKSRQHLAFFDLAGGHGLRVDNLHHVTAHVLETLVAEALVAQLPALVCRQAVVASAPRPLLGRFRE